MPILDLNKELEVEKFLDFQSKHPYRSLLQDIRWVKNRAGWDYACVYVEDGEGIKATISILIRKIAPGVTMFYAPRGPVMDINDTRLFSRLLYELKPLVKKYKPFMLKIDPEIKEGDILEETYQYFEDRGMRVSKGLDDPKSLIQPRMNMILDLRGHDEDSIMMQYSKKNRNLVRYAKKHGVEVKQENSEDFLEKFYQTYEFMAIRNEIGYREINYFKNLLQIYPESIKIFITEHDGDLMSGSFVINYYGKVYYLYAGSNNTKRKLNPNQYMNHIAICESIHSGAEQYDMGGIFTTDKDDGLYHFKKHFCDKDGVTTYLGEVDIIYNKALYKAYHYLMPRWIKFQQQRSQKRAQKIKEETQK